MTNSSVSAEDFADIIDQLRQFLRTVVVPREREIAEGDGIPDDLRDAAKELGLFGYAIPEEWGGLGLDPVQEAELSIELGYASLAFRSMFGTNNGIAGQVLTGYGTTAQQEQWLGAIASGDVVTSFALTEAGAGSDPSSIRTRARKVDGGWRLSGEKRFITNAPNAHLFIAFAKADADADGDESIEVFLVPRDAEGITIGVPDTKMGQSGALTADVHFGDVFVPDEALIGGARGIGYRAAMTSLAKGRITIAALAVGQAVRAHEESLAFATTAQQGETIIGDFQLVQAMLADQRVGVDTGRSIVLDTARKYASGSDRRVAPSVAKLYCTEMVGRVADLAVQIHGGSGYMRDYPVERIYRDAQ
jgi:acyl-CoA dehydrogenase